MADTLSALELGPDVVIDDKYRIVRLIGQGGMGAVYEGEHTRVRRRVAIKVLQPGLAGTDEAVERFEREAQAAGQIGSDHIMEVYDLGVLEGGQRYMVMEFIDGETLGERLSRAGCLTAAEVFPLARQLLHGLARAHQAGIVHRDLKPDNVFIAKEKAGIRDFVKIIDFGISKFQSLAADGMRMTRTGTILGTPYYMSPEQAYGKPTDARSDLYSVGVILYECVAGRVPFTSDNFNSLLFEIAAGKHAPPSSFVGDLDPAFEGIIQKAMATDASRRFQSADEFVAELDRWALASGLSLSTFDADRLSRLASAQEQAAAGGLATTTRAAAAATTAGAPSGIGSPTTNAWATSQLGDAPPRRLNKRLVVASVGVLAVACAVGLMARVLLRAPKSDGTAASTPASAAVAAGLAPATSSAASTRVVQKPDAPAHAEKPAGADSAQQAELDAGAHLATEQPPRAASSAPVAAPRRARRDTAQPPSNAISSKSERRAAPQTNGSRRRDFGY